MKNVWCAKKRKHITVLMDHPGYILISRQPPHANENEKSTTVNACYYIHSEQNIYIDPRNMMARDLCTVLVYCIVEEKATPCFVNLH